MLTLAETTARRWEPKRLRLLSIAGRLTRGTRRVRLHLAAHAPWTPLLIAALEHLHSLPAAT